MFDRGRTTHRSVPRLALFAAATLLASACLESSIVQVSVEDVVEIRVTPDSTRVAVGRTVQSQALALDGSGTLIVGVDPTWSSGDAAVATVDAEGVVTGVAVGSTHIVASVGGFSDTTAVEVLEPPVLVLSDDAASFSAEAGGGDPPPQTLQITNGGELPLEGLAVDSIVYHQVTEGWLSAELSATASPADLDLTVATSGITSAATYTATVWVSATDADGSPATVDVTLELTPGSAASIESNDGDGQSGQVGQELPTSPSVLVLDAFDNPVPGVEVAFSVTGGGGSVSGSPATTDASGVARVGSWVLGVTAGANSLDASLASVGTVGFTATGVAGPATQLQIVAGDGQAAVAGSSVSTSPSVATLDAFDNAVEGIQVVFTVESGDGSITGGTQTSDATGVATAGTWTLGTTAGTNTVEARAASIPDSVTFTATGIPGGIEQISLVDGDAQTDTVAATLPVQYAVRVADINDNAIPGVTVSWQTTAGGGSITGTSDTDAAGVARATRVLGTTAGANAAIATIGGVADTVTFTATATAGTPATLVAVAGTGQSATVDTSVPVAPSVIVTDGFDNPVAGHSVTFAVTSAGGSISPAGAQVTQADGTASLTSWTLGTLAAAQSDTVEVTAAGGAVAPNPLLLTATATPGAAASFTVVQGSGQTAITGSNVSQAPTVRVADQFGNGVSGVTVGFSSSGSGSVGSPSTTTNTDGEAVTTWTVDVGGHSLGTDGTYQNTLTASTAGFSDQQLTGFARYSYPQHVSPLWADCSGCHDGSLAFTLTYGSLVDQIADCDSGFVRVSSAGGVNAEENLSVLTRYLNAGLPNPPGCTSHTGGTRTGETLDIMRAWVRNGAPNN